MNSFNLIVSVFAFIVVCGAETGLKKYENEEDIESVLNDEKLVTTYVKCLLGETRCTPDGEIIRESIVQAIQNTCSTCTEIQQDRVRKLMRFMLTNRPSDFHKIFKKFDPDSKYKPKMIEFMNKSS